MTIPIRCPCCGGTGQMPASFTALQVRVLRQRSGLTWKQIAELTGYSATTLSHLGGTDNHKSPGAMVAFLALMKERMG